MENEEKLTGRAGIILRLNQEKQRAKLGEVKTTLTRAIATRDGLKAYKVQEIQWVYGVDRATAYRWKKADVHPLAEPHVTSNDTIYWVYSSESYSRRALPCNPKRDVIRQARSSIRCALNKLKKMQEDPCYDCYPLDKSCEDMANDIDHDTRDLTTYILDESGYLDREDEDS